jgi:galactoside O-acetyltransferase
VISGLYAMIVFLGTTLVRVCRRTGMVIAVYQKYKLILPEGCELGEISNIELGRNFGMAPNVQIFARGGISSPSIRVGDDVHFERNVMINADSGGSIRIGNHVRVGPNSIFRASNHCFDRDDVPICEQGHQAGQITVGNDVWFGAGVIVLPDVSIGDGAVIGAGAVVAKDIPERAIAVGLPAVPVSFR